MEIYKDQHEVRRISCCLRFFALCKSLLCGCKFFAQNDAKGLAECTSYGAVSADNRKGAVTLAKGTSYGAVSVDNRKGALTLAKGTSYGAVSVDNRKSAVTLAKGTSYGAASSDKRKRAFTLAEVLITLGIIGVVAAITLPAVVNKYQKIVTQNKLKKFYTVMHQAIKLAEAENGDFTSWAPTSDMSNSSAALEQWYNKYLDKHIISIHKKRVDNQHFLVGFKDGSGFDGYISRTTNIYIFYCTDLKYCGPEKFDGKVTFLFVFNAGIKGYFQPYGYGVPRQTLLQGCKFGNNDNPNVSSAGRRHYCAALIQIDGWEIKDDYPWNQIMIEN